MGFGGGGSNVTKAHTHDSTVVQDGGSLAANVTQFGLSSGSILYSDGSNIQELSVGVGAQILGVSGSLPAWITNTSNPLVKVSKTYSDITGTTLDIYTLPQDAALCNIWADITTVFDGSTTTVEAGDSADANGFSQAADWQALGLTDATRGPYITDFKGMRSTSGNTNIVATAGSTLTQAGDSSDANATMSEASYKQITGLTSGDAINFMSWDIYNAAGMNFKWALYDDDANTPNNMLGNEVEITMPAITNTYTTVEVATSGSPVVPGDGIVWVGMQAYNNTTISIRSTGNPPSSYANSIYDSGQVYSAGFPDPATATSGGGNNYRAGVKTPTAFGSTQGEVDFYLQVVD